MLKLSYESSYENLRKKYIIIKLLNFSFQQNVPVCSKDVIKQKRFNLFNIQWINIDSSW